MGSPAIVQGDRIVGLCTVHQIPNPAAGGSPMPSPPLPFSAQLTKGLSTDVFVGGKAAAIVDSSGYNSPPHPGLHTSDQYFVSTTQEGKVGSGSSTVFFGGKAAANSQSSCTCCSDPGQLTPTVTSVEVG